MPQSLSLKEQAVVAEYQYWKERQRQLEAREETPFNPTERHKGSEHQAKADEAYQFHGRQAPAQREGESAETYNRRLLTGLQVYHPELKDVDLHTAPQRVVDNFGREIMQAALSPKSHAVDVPYGAVKEIKTRMLDGREKTDFIRTDGRTFIHDMARPSQRTYAAGGKFLNPLELQAYGRFVPTEGREQPSGDRLTSQGRMPLRHGMPR
jgi:hypothetical protein